MCFFGKAAYCFPPFVESFLSQDVSLRLIMCTSMRRCPPACRTAMCPPGGHMFRGSVFSTCWNHQFFGCFNLFLRMFPTFWHPQHVAVQAFVCPGVCSIM